MAHGARANVDMQLTTAALMRLDVPYLKNYVEGFPFEAIKLNINMTRLHSLFDTDPELREVLREIDLHMSALVKRYTVILPNGTTFFDTSGRNGADYHHEEWEDEEDLDYGDLVVLGANEVDLVLRCIEEGLAALDELANTFENNINVLHAQFLRDQSLHKASVELVKRLNSGIQRLLNVEIISLVFLLEEILD